MTLTLLSEQDYLKHTQVFPNHSFLQTPEMAHLLEKRGFKVDYVGLEADGALQVAGLLYSKPMTGGLHMEINSGPSSKNPAYLKAFYQELQAYAKSQGCLRLVVKPADNYQTFDTNGEPISDQAPHLISDLTDLGFVHDGLQTGYPGGEPDWHYIKNLSQLTPDTLFQSFSKKGRPLVKKTRTFGIKLRTLTRDELHIFKDITASTSERREYEDKPLDYYQDFYDAFGDAAEFVVAEINFKDYQTNLQTLADEAKAQVQVIQAEIDALEKSSAKKNKQLKEATRHYETFIPRLEEVAQLIAQHGTEDVILAASLFIYTPHEAVYLFSGSYTAFNHFYAPVILQEHVMNKAISLGIPSYNFLGIQGIFDGSDGVLRFKQNFNGYIVRKMGTFTYYPNPLKFKTISAIKKVLGRE